MSANVLSTWWVNRASLYWIPAVLALLVVRDLPMDGIKALWVGVICIAIFVALAEQFLFSFKFSIEGGLLIVRQGWLAKKQFSILQKDIRSASLQPLMANVSMKSARVDVKLKNGEQKIVNLSSLRRSDAHLLMRWLGVDE